MNYEDIVSATASEWTEVEIPTERETFEAQVLVVTRPRKERRYSSPFGLSIAMPPYPLQTTHRVLGSGKFHVELVMSSLANGKPTLIITEDEV